MVTNIPLELRFTEQWVCWKLEDRDGKPTKIPIDAKTLRCADVSNSATYSSFTVALQTFQNRNFSGIGFVLTRDDPFVGIDLDKCISDDGVIRPEAQEIVSLLNSYTETSPSHHGLHVWCKGKLCEGDRKKDFVEMYDWGRYLTLTGDVLGKELPIRECTNELNEIHRRFIARESLEDWVQVPTGQRHEWIRTRALNQAKLGTPPNEIMNWGIKTAVASGLTGTRLDQIIKMLEWACYKSRVSRGIVRDTYRSEQKEAVILDASTAAHWVEPEVDWLIPGLIPKNRLILCGADSQTGKSKFWLYALFAAAKGMDFCDFLNVAKSKIAYLCLEDPRNRLRARLNEFREDFDGYPEKGYLQCIFDNNFELATSLDQIKEYAVSGFDVLVIDTYQKACPGGDVNDQMHHSRMFQSLARICRDSNCTILVIDHLRKRDTRDRGKMPVISDIIGSQVKAQNCDSVILMHRWENTLLLNLRSKDLDEEKTFKIQYQPHDRPKYKRLTTH